jgi:hypothetical protein
MTLKVQLIVVSFYSRGGVGFGWTVGSSGFGYLVVCSMVWHVFFFLTDSIVCFSVFGICLRLKVALCECGESSSIPEYGSMLGLSRQGVEY